MSDELRQRVEAAVNDYKDPGLGFSLGELRALRETTLDGRNARFYLRLGFPAKRFHERLRAGLKQALAELVDEAVIDIDCAIQPHAGQQGVERLAAVKNIIAVASGKGGVGKSTVAVNLALALAAEGARVGMLDADIYGPSQPRMLGVSGKPKSPDGQSIEPMIGHGIQSMSIGYLIDPDAATVWRGPMVSQGLQQLLRDTAWDDLDYLIVDMPPGTGDAQLTLAQRVPLAGAVIVTTPQEIATQDARKGIEMFNKVRVPILGVVENMSLHVCTHCGHTERLFGEGGGAALAKRYQVPLLGELPLDAKIREHADNGRPSVVADPDGDAAKRYTGIALRMAAGLSRESKDYARKFPKIVVEGS